MTVMLRRREFRWLRTNNDDKASGICRRSSAAGPPAVLALPLASDRRGTARPFLHARLDPGRPKVVVVHVLERHGHHFGQAVDGDVAEELQAEAGRQILTLLLATAFLEHRPRPEGVVEPPRRV